MDKRKKAKELFNKSGIIENAYNWHIWKRAFDLGWAYHESSDSGLNIDIVSQRSELFFCDYCKEVNPHNINRHKKTKECEGCGLITKV